MLNNSAMLTTIKQESHMEVPRRRGFSIVQNSEDCFLSGISLEKKGNRKTIRVITLNTGAQSISLTYDLEIRYVDKG